jgi:hypothetical protein
MRIRFALAILALCCAGQPAAARQLPTGPEIQALVFGDVNYMFTDRDVAAGFRLGQLVGHLNAGLTDRLAFFGEVSLTPQPAAYALEVERMILRYDFSDVLKLSAGRYHTPVSYWNIAYHHGSWLQTSVARPEMIRFGSRVVPVHFVGAQAEGNLPLSPLGLSYAVGVGNGRGANIARGGDAGEVHSSRAFTANLNARPTLFGGLNIGAAMYLDRVAGTAGAPDINERILSAHVVRQWESPEIAAEYARMRHAEVGPASRATTSDAWYVQLGYRLPGAAQDFKPYVRAERVDVPPANPLLGGQNLNYEALLAGVRYDFAQYAALKAEYRREQFAAPGWTQSLVLQASFAVPGLTGAAGPMHHSNAGFGALSSPFRPGGR